MKLGFRDRITLRPDSSAAGDPVPDYTGAAAASGVPARIISVRGDETFRGRQLDANVDYVVEMQSLDSIVPQMRVEVDSGAFAGRLLNVSYVKQLPFSNGRPAKLELHCREAQ